MQAKAGAEQRQRIVVMIRLRMAVPLEPTRLAPLTWIPDIPSS
jgi:hypothetical protein